MDNQRAELRGDLRAAGSYLLKSRGIDTHVAGWNSDYALRAIIWFRSSCNGEDKAAVTISLANWMEFVLQCLG